MRASSSSSAAVRVRRFLLAKAAGMLAVLALVAVLVFVLTRAASGDPVAVLLGDQATADDIARVRQQYGLDQPLPAQFGYWLREVASGNLGQSIFLQRPVTQALLERAEPTALLALLAVAIAAAIGIPCGVVSAVFRGRLIDQWCSGLAMLGASIPSFWLGLVLIQVFAVSLGWFPVSGYGAPEAPLAERLHALVLPASVLGLLNSALILRFTRASMLDVLGEDYVRTARSKGLPETTVVLKHALRNALVPIVTVLGLTVALMIGGAVVTETVFGLPGVGSLLVNAVLRRDYPVIQGALLVVAVIYVLINFAIDLLYAIVDPRVQA
jgi:peptide/nickel transport system permease protein